MLIFIIVLSVLLLSVFFATLYVYRIAFYTGKKRDDVYDIPPGDQYDPIKAEMIALVDKLMDIKCEDVYVKAFDGVLLHGRYYHVKDNAPLDIQFHGYRAAAFRDSCVAGNASIERGHNLLLVDQRGQGESKSNTMTMGIKEHRDVLTWVEFSLDKFGKDIKIMLYGLSMGASSVVMATALELPENVKGILADCPYSSPTDIIAFVAKNTTKMPRYVSVPFAALAARVFGGFKLTGFTCKDAVKNAKIPILLFHGEADHYVPCYMSEEIKEANKAMVDRYTFPGAGHGVSYFSDKKRYHDLLEEFVTRCLNS